MTTRDSHDWSSTIETARRSPLVLMGILDQASVTRLRAWSDAIAPEAWCSGDDSAHSWSEHHLAADDVARLCAELPVLDQLAMENGAVVGWLNRFRRGEWIGSHVDAAGDVQCIVPLTVPACADGGQLWIGSVGQSVPAGPGDIVLFNAAARPHGTTPVTESMAERVTLNVRFWLSGPTRSDPG